MKKWVFPFVWLLSGLSLLGVELRVARVFSDNMVLQQGAETPVWGWAKPGELVKVEYGEVKAHAVVDGDGYWEATLKDIPVNYTGMDLVITGGHQILFSNVLAGEVWYFMGQSNMSWPVAESKGVSDIMEQPEQLRGVRYFEVPVMHSGEVREDLDSGAWVEVTKDTVGAMSALALLYARELQVERPMMPVGIVMAAVGGSNAKLWISRTAQKRNLNLNLEIEEYEERMANWNEAAANRIYKKRIVSWKKKKERAEKAGRRIPREPVKPVHPKDSYQRHGSYYNAMVAPVISMAIQGVILYHGSANVNVPEEYAVLFPMLIDDWREQWGRQDLPFLYVQLANYRKEQFDPVHKRDRLPYLREAQCLGLKKMHTAMVVTTDLGDIREQYLKDKTQVAKRLYQAAKEVVYEEPSHSQCPTYFYMKAVHGRVIITFDHVADGLMAKGGKLKGFAITGSDRQWVWAETEIIDKTIVLWHPDIPQPAAVRYNWADNPIGNLYSLEGYPASSFRTDDWTRNSISKNDQAKWVRH